MSAGTFADILPVIERGGRAARKGWHRKNMFVFKTPGNQEGEHIDAETAKILGLPEGAAVKSGPKLNLRTPDGSVHQWTIAVADVLEVNDWYEVTDEDLAA